MREQISILTQSRFFSPVFNGAIFDGPIRIYFSQSQEAAAMKMYFAVLARMRTLFGDLRQNFQEGCENVFVLIYPTTESFNLVFPSDSRQMMQIDRLEDDYVVGLSGPMDEQDFPKLFEALDEILSSISRPAEIEQPL